jgi:hypothetical protein
MITLSRPTGNAGTINLTADDKYGGLVAAGA